MAILEFPASNHKEFVIIFSLQLFQKENQKAFKLHKENGQFFYFFLFYIYSAHISMVLDNFKWLKINEHNFRKKINKIGNFNFWTKNRMFPEHFRAWTPCTVKCEQFRCQHSNNSFCRENLSETSVQQNFYFMKSLFSCRINCLHPTDTKKPVTNMSIIFITVFYVTQ